MSKIRLCDICGEREASRSFKCKRSNKGRYVAHGSGITWMPIWNPYEKIDICGECGERLLNLKYRDPNGLGRLTFKEMTGNDI